MKHNQTYRITLKQSHKLSPISFITSFILASLINQQRIRVYSPTSFYTRDVPTNTHICNGASITHLTSTSIPTPYHILLHHVH